MDVHLWSANLNSTNSQEEKYLSLLSKDEKGRAAKFRFKRDASHYIIARGILRQLLGKYLSKPSGDLVFEYSKYGKPSLAGNDNLQFNLSHAADKALFAITKETKIGVDIEEKKDIEVKRLAQRFFSKNESEYIFKQSASDWENLFFKCWTRKEAFIKAHGAGLNLPLDQFEVSLDDSEPVYIKSIKWKPNSASDWQLFTTSPFENYFGAVVCKSKDKHLLKFNWTH